MTIKELNEFMRDHGFCNTDNEEDLPKKYVCDLVESALKEGRNKAIEEFAERLKDLIAKNVEDAEKSNDLCCEIFQSEIDKIAEEMRGAE